MTTNDLDVGMIRGAMYLAYQRGFSLGRNTNAPPNPDSVTEIPAPENLVAVEKEARKWGALEALARVNERVLEAYGKMRPDQEWVFVVISILRLEAEMESER